MPPNHVKPLWSEAPVKGQAYCGQKVKSLFFMPLLVSLYFFIYFQLTYLQMIWWYLYTVMTTIQQDLQFISQSLFIALLTTLKIHKGQSFYQFYTFVQRCFTKWSKLSTFICIAKSVRRMGQRVSSWDKYISIQLQFYFQSSTCSSHIRKMTLMNLLHVV